METWKPKGDWKIIPLGKGFFMIRLTCEDDLEEDMSARHRKKDLDAKRSDSGEKQGEDVQKARRKIRGIETRTKCLDRTKRTMSPVETMGTDSVEVPTTTTTEVVPIDVGTVDSVVERKQPRRMHKHKKMELITLMQYHNLW
ncbi:hypothetical protein IFM89_012303 [Coptis chinensis]|uniref:Uncharacterized protein n=1 Tax=Coptis chinensis TaxID=261450 RepID=A0A835LL65_9MAGN|nr:hypothetical protein IFM89_012303 [Coptis chinensis]